MTYPEMTEQDTEETVSKLLSICRSYRENDYPAASDLASAQYYFALLVASHGLPMALLYVAELPQ